ncbi:MAG: hypothetical protein ABFE01_00155 [Phycisphaerales bacterium]|jgi:hypothetical protein
MAWRIETDVQPGYLVIRVFGQADGRVAGEIIAGVFREIASHDCSNFLIDIRGIDGRLGVLETFHMVSTYPSQQGVRAAIVDRPEYSNWYEFYETVSVNRGYHNKVFTDIEKAIEWLSS